MDFDRAVRIATEGVPLAGRFKCQFESVHKRERHDNGSIASDVLAAVRKKFTKEEKLSYHILFPRFLWAFLPGLFLALITWVPPKGRPGDEGRMCVDPSTIQDGGTPNDVILDDGAANAQLPDTGRPEKPGLPDENLLVYYGTALTRFLIWIYNLRIDNPVDEICLSADNITAAFRCLLYHPDMAVLWAKVFQECLVIPCGMIFGGKNSPSFLMSSGPILLWLGTLAMPLPHFRKPSSCPHRPLLERRTNDTRHY